MRLRPFHRHSADCLRTARTATRTATQSIKGTIQTSGGPLMIGGNNVSGEYFDGLIDTVRVYNRALVAEEIQTNMVTPIE